MDLSKIAKKMIQTILIIAVIAVTISIVYYRSLDFLPFLYGVVVGTFSSVLKVVLLDRAVDKAVAMDKKSAHRYVTKQHFLRMIISALALILGAFVDLISLWGVIVGVLSYQLGAYGTHSVS